MADIVKTIPNELDGDSKYSIRVRSINSFGIPSAWSEALVVDTSGAGLSSAGRLIITENGMAGYTDAGQLAFGYYSATDTRTNEVCNPSFEVNLTGWQATPTASFARSTATYFFAQPGLGASCLVQPSNNNVNEVGIEQSAVHRFPVAADEIWTVSAFVKPNLANRFKIGLKFYNGGGTLIQESLGVKEYNVSNSLWNRISAVAIKAPAGTASAAVIIKAVKPMASGEHYFVDGVLAEEGGILKDYFDGSTSAGNTTWTGSANESSSQFLIESPYYENGSVATGGVVQTNPNVELIGGIKLTPAGFYAYNPSGDQKVFISALTGDITAVDGTFTGSTFQTGLGVGSGSPNAVSGVIFNDAGIRGFSGTGTVPSFELNTNGAMTARSGEIGGWDITGTALSNSNVVLHSAGEILVGTGNNIAVMSSVDANLYRLWIGHATSSLAPFRVTQAGELFASNATISGNISATTGSIGGWVVGSTTLTGGNVTLDSAGQIRLGTGNNVVYLDSTSAYRIWVGHATATSAPFRVSQTGAMTATAGSIGGVLIANDELYVGSGGFKAGMREAQSPGDWVFYAGATDPADAPYRVTNEGYLVASSGFIGEEGEGWEVDAISLKSTGSALASIHLESDNAGHNPRIYILNDQATPNTPGFGNSATTFYADSLGQFSLKDKLLFDPGNTQTGGLGTLTVIGKIRGAIENFEIIQLDKGQKTPTNAVLTSDIVTLTFGSPHGFAVGDTIINEGFTGIYVPMIGAWRVLTVPTNSTLTFALEHTDIASGNPGGTARTRVREMTLGIHPEMISPDGGVISPAGLGIRLDEYNYWFLNNKFRVGTSNTYVNWDGATFTVKGTILADAGQFLGYVTAGTARIGANVESTNDGLWVNANNYWYDSGLFKAGGVSQYVEWDGDSLNIVGTLVGGLVQSSNWDAEDTGTPSVWFSDAGTQIDLTTGNIITPGMFVIGSTGQIYARAITLTDELDDTIARFTADPTILMPGGDSGNAIELRHGESGSSYLTWNKDNEFFGLRPEIQLGTPLSIDVSDPNTSYANIYLTRKSRSPHYLGESAIHLTSLNDYLYFGDELDTSETEITSHYYWYTTFPGVAGNNLQIQFGATDAGAANFKIELNVWMSDWTPSTQMVFASQWGTAANQRSWQFGINTNGTFFFNTSVDGINTTKTFTSIDPVRNPALLDVDTGWRQIRVDFLGNDGLGNARVQFLCRVGDIFSETPPSWQNVNVAGGSEYTISAGTTTLFNTADPVYIGGSNLGTANLFVGRINKIYLDKQNAYRLDYHPRDVDRANPTEIIPSASNKYLGGIYDMGPFPVKVFKSGGTPLTFVNQQDTKRALIKNRANPHEGSIINLNTFGRISDPTGNLDIISTPTRTSTEILNKTINQDTSSITTRFLSEVLRPYVNGFFEGNIELYASITDEDVFTSPSISYREAGFRVNMYRSANPPNPLPATTTVDIFSGSGNINLNASGNINLTAANIYQNGGRSNARYVRRGSTGTAIPPFQVWGVDFDTTVVDDGGSWIALNNSQFQCQHSGMYSIAYTITTNAVQFNSGTFIGIYFVGIGMYARQMASRSSVYETIHMSRTTYCPAGLTISFVMYHDGPGTYNSLMTVASPTVTDGIMPSFEIVRVS